MAGHGGEAGPPGHGRPRPRPAVRRPTFLSLKGGAEVSKGNILAAIDVGSTKVCALVAEMMPDTDPAPRHAGLRVLGVGIAPAQGMRKGMVDNLQECTQAIRTAVEKGERSSGTRILSAHVGIGGGHVSSLNNRGVATIPGRQRPITKEDI